MVTHAERIGVGKCQAESTADRSVVFLHDVDFATHILGGLPYVRQDALDHHLFQGRVDHDLPVSQDRSPGCRVDAERQGRNQRRRVAGFAGAVYNRGLHRGGSIDQRVQVKILEMGKAEVEYVTVARVGAIPEGGGASFVAKGRMIAVFHYQGTYHAIDDLCPHMGASLAEGFLEDGIVSCPVACLAFLYL